MAHDPVMAAQAQQMVATGAAVRKLRATDGAHIQIMGHAGRQPELPVMPVTVISI